MFSQKITPKFSIISAVVAAVVFLYMPFTAQATGISPSMFLLEDAVSNVPITQTFYVSRIDTSEPEVLRLSARGEAKDMITFPDGALQLFRRGEGGKKLRFTITPGNIAAGHYKGNIRAEQTQVSPDAVADLEAGGPIEKVVAKSFAGAYNLSAAQLDIDMAVTNKMVERWEVKGHDLSKAEEDTPISFNIIIDNQGSVATKPGKVELKIREEKGTEFIANETVPGDNLSLLPPYNVNPESVLTGIRLKIGRYYAYIKVFDREGTLVYDSDKVFLEIVPQGTLAQKGILKQLKVDKQVPEGDTMPTYKPNQPAVITGLFGNQGEVGVRTLLTVEVYKDTEKIDLLKSTEAYVARAAEGEFNIDYKFPEESIYTLKGYFSYGISKTNVGEVKVRVSLKAPELTANKGSVLKGSLSGVGFDSLSLLPLLFALLTLIALGLLFFYFFAKHSYPLGAVCLWPDTFCQWPVCKWSSSKQNTNTSTPPTITQQKP